MCVCLVRSWAAYQWRWLDMDSVLAHRQWKHIDLLPKISVLGRVMKLSRGSEDNNLPWGSSSGEPLLALEPGRNGRQKKEKKAKIYTSPDEIAPTATSVSKQVDENEMQFSHPWGCGQMIFLFASLLSSYLHLVAYSRKCQLDLGFKLYILIINHFSLGLCN